MVPGELLICDATPGDSRVCYHGTMSDLIILFIPLVVTFAQFLGPGGMRSVMAESLLVKQQLLILNRSRQRSPNLRASDRLVAGLCALLLRPIRLIRSAIVLKPSTLFSLHHALKNRKYRLLFSSKRSGTVDRTEFVLFPEQNQREASGNRVGRGVASGRGLRSGDEPLVHRDPYLPGRRRCQQRVPAGDSRAVPNVRSLLQWLFPRTDYCAARRFQSRSHCSETGNGYFFQWSRSAFLFSQFVSKSAQDPNPWLPGG